MTSFDPATPDLPATDTGGTAPVGATPVPAEPDPVESAPAEPAPALPTMGDLDRLSAALDQVDRTLAELDGFPRLAQA